MCLLHHVYLYIVVPTINIIYCIIVLHLKMYIKKHLVCTVQSVAPNILMFNDQLASCYLASRTLVYERICDR